MSWHWRSLWVLFSAFRCFFIFVSLQQATQKSDRKYTKRKRKGWSFVDTQQLHCNKFAQLHRAFSIYLFGLCFYWFVTRTTNGKKKTKGTVDRRQIATLTRTMSFLLILGTIRMHSIRQHEKKSTMFYLIAWSAIIPLCARTEKSIVPMQFVHCPLPFHCFVDFNSSMNLQLFADLRYCIDEIDSFGYFCLILSINFCCLPHFFSSILCMVQLHIVSRRIYF